MKKKRPYYVNWRYSSSLGGPWKIGDEVTLDEETAIAINNDSPGVLTPLEEVTEEAAKQEVPASDTSLPDAPPADRQLKAASRRQVERHMPPEPQEPGAQEPIDKTTFKAVRDT